MQCACKKVVSLVYRIAQKGVDVAIKLQKINEFGSVAFTSSSNHLFGCNRSMLWLRNRMLKLTTTSVTSRGALWASVRVWYTAVHIGVI